MACYSPLSGWRSRVVNPGTGKRSIVFNPSLGLQDMPVEVTCDKCIGCRLERSRQWAIRLVHESQLFSNNCFLTLTYNDEHLPVNGSLDLDEFQRFMKRFREKFSGIEPVVDKNGKTTFPIRFFHCGEYGSKFQRPHYHACIFNFDFPDKVLWKNLMGNRLYTSELLQKLWSDKDGNPLGFVSIGSLSFESAAYVARYITKKITGDMANDHYKFIDGYGNEVMRKPEYITMSRRPGIASRWYEKYGHSVHPSDSIAMNGRLLRPPKFYDRLYEIKEPSDFRRLKEKRKLNALKFADENRSLRLSVRQDVQLLRFKRLKRSYEDD